VSAGVGRLQDMYFSFILRHWVTREEIFVAASKPRGDIPWAGVILNAEGKVYGTTEVGGSGP
jgi:hypothetical protein